MIRPRNGQVVLAGVVTLFVLPLAAFGQTLPAATNVATAPAVAPRTSAAATLTDAERLLIDDAKERSEIMANLEYLSDVIGPRLTGSRNMKAANDWAAEKMRQYGLVNVHLEPYTIPMGWERGEARARVVTPDNGMRLAVAAMAWTPGIRGKVTGDVVMLRAQTEEELAPYKGKLKNAIVLQGLPSEVSRVATNAEKGDPNAPKTYASTGTLPRPAGNAGRRPSNYAAYRAFRQKVSAFLREEGAAAVLLDSGKPHGLLNMTGSWSSLGAVKDGKPERMPLPTLFVAHDHYALLYRLAQQAAKGNGSALRVELEVESKFTKGPVTVYNTVGEVTGSERPDEIVVLGAHLDSWDLAQGTTDNGTGSCVVLEAARLLAKNPVKPKRTVRFVLFSGEEQGLFGSKAYVEAHKDELPKMSAAFVHDTGTGRVIGFGVEGRDELKPILEPEVAALKDLGFTGGLSDGGVGPGTDHWSFHERGVPGFAFQQDPAEYRLTHHSNSDTLDKAREPDLIEGAQIMSLLALRVANLPDLLPQRIPEPRGGRGPRTGATGTDEHPDEH